MANAAFKDLEIDVSDMSDNPTSFSKRVYDKVVELREALKQDTSTASLMRKMEESNTPADKTFHVLFEGVYTYADEYPLEMMPAIISLAEEMVKDLKTAFEDRIIRESASQSGSIQNKRMLHEQYMAVRQSFNKYVEFMNAFMSCDLATIPPLPGNYSNKSGGLAHYVYEYKGEQYRNPRALFQELGIPVDRMPTYMDTVDYLESHPELEVVIKKVM